VTVSACWSASLTAAQQRRLLGLPAPAEEIQTRDPERSRRSRLDETDDATLATTLAGRSGPAPNRTRSTRAP
jgi:hypothetical protein